MIPDSLEGVDSNILNPMNAWDNKDFFMDESKKLSTLFKENFDKFGKKVT